MKENKARRDARAMSVERLKFLEPGKDDVDADDFEDRTDDSDLVIADPIMSEAE